MAKSKIDFDDFTVQYNDLIQKGTSFFTKNDQYFSEYKVNIVKQELNSDVSVFLEYGCGIGRNIPFLRGCFPNTKIIGSDISEASLEFARKLNPDVEFVHETPRSMSECCFDAILVVGVLHHVQVKERVAVVRSLFRKLKPGGTVFIFEHNPYNPVTLSIVNDCPFDEDAVLLPLAETVSLLRLAGFKVTKKRYCLFMPPVMSRMLFLEGLLQWLPLGGNIG